MWVTSTLPRPPPRHHHPRTRAHPTDPITFVPSKAWGLHQAREAPGGRAPHPPGGPGLSGGFTGTGLQEGTEGGSAVARLGARDRVGPGGSPHPFPAPAWEARARVAPEGPSGVTAGINIRIKIAAPEGVSGNKMKGENPRGNPESAGEAKRRAS